MGAARCADRPPAVHERGPKRGPGLGAYYARRDACCEYVQSGLWQEPPGPARATRRREGGASPTSTRTSPADAAPGGAGLRRHAMGRRQQRAGGGRDHLCPDVSDGVIAGAVELVHGHANDTAAATGASAMTVPASAVRRMRFSPARSAKYPCRYRSLTARALRCVLVEELCESAVGGRRGGEFVARALEAFNQLAMIGRAAITRPIELTRTSEPSNVDGGRALRRSVPTKLSFPAATESRA